MYSRSYNCVVVMVLTMRCHSAEMLSAQSPTGALTGGIRPVVVEHRELVPPNRPIRLAQRPFLALGGTRVNEREEFDPRHAQFSVVRASDGSIIANDRNALKIYSANGQLIRIVGREGNGPGEFSETREACIVGKDTVLVIDNPGRPSLWDTKGTHLHTFQNVGYVIDQSCAHDGTVLVARTTGSPRTSSTSDYLKIRFDGKPMSVLRNLPLYYMNGPLWYDLHLLPVRDGLIVADARRFEIRLIGLDGEVRRILRVGTPARVVRDADWQALAERRFPSNTPESQRRRLVASLLAKRRPGVATFPRFRRVLAGPTGQLWIQSYDSPLDWDVFSGSGSYMGRVRLPFSGSGTGIVAVFKDHVVVRHYNDDGAPVLSFIRFE